jgi:hypothetical protein
MKKNKTKIKILNPEEYMNKKIIIKETNQIFPIQTISTSNSGLAYNVLSFLNGKEISKCRRISKEWKEQSEIILKNLINIKMQNSKTNNIIGKYYEQKESKEDQKLERKGFF